MSFNAGSFDALRVMVNFARNRTRCSLALAQSHALNAGFTKEEVDEATKFWAEYEAKKVRP